MNDPAELATIPLSDSLPGTARAPEMRTGSGRAQASRGTFQVLLRMAQRLRFRAALALAEPQSGELPLVGARRSGPMGGSRVAAIVEVRMQATARSFV
jgi:hypothetical protein